MDIEELEYIRDFEDHLETIRRNLTGLVFSVDPDNDEKCLKEEVPIIVLNYILTVLDQLQLITDSYREFKNKVDIKYFDEWKKAYPNGERILTLSEIKREKFL